jgi:hypothetical protein
MERNHKKKEGKKHKGGRPEMKIDLLIVSEEFLFVFFGKSRAGILSRVKNKI